MKNKNLNCLSPYKNPDASTGTTQHLSPIMGDLLKAEVGSRVTNILVFSIIGMSIVGVEKLAEVFAVIPTGLLEHETQTTQYLLLALSVIAKIPEIYCGTQIGVNGIRLFNLAIHAMENPNEII